MNDYTLLMNEQKSLAKRLNKDNYQKAFAIAKEFFPKENYSIQLFERNATHNDGQQRNNLTLERMTQPTLNYHVKTLFMHFYEAPLDDPFLQEIQVDTHSRSENSHKVNFFKKDDISGLYLMDDYHSENILIPDEKLFIFKSKPGLSLDF